MSAESFDIFDVVDLVGGHHARGVVAVFVCYLDDSDSNLSQVATLGGYVSTIPNWQRFESLSAELFQKYGVEIYQTKRIVQSKSCFKGWSREKKLSFMSEWADIAVETVTFGVAVATRRSFHKRFIKENPKNSQMSPYGVSFSAILHIVCSNNPLREKIRQDGVSFVIETGQPNNGEIEKFFHKHKGHQAFQGAPRSIRFADKKSSRAVQLADLFAYHGRRILATNDRLGPNIAVPAHELFQAFSPKMPHIMRSVRSAQNVSDAGIDMERVKNPETSKLWEWLSRPH